MPFLAIPRTVEQTNLSLSLLLWSLHRTSQSLLRKSTRLSGKLQFAKLEKHIAIQFRHENAHTPQLLNTTLIEMDKQEYSRLLCIIHKAEWSVCLLVSRASPSYPIEGERVWSNAYRAHVPAHCIVRANQMHGIKSHDCEGMKGMQINGARSYP